ncbi:hypothetical protein WJX74_002401 [Apatococcus lobatus]|uniref:RING-type domain-containing protein n=1 Tax=Apatococcus lobatus TaxID=904363 RepID=A0AAW1RJN6_9CHLO
MAHPSVERRHEEEIWLRELEFLQTCIQCGQVFRELDNSSTACKFHTDAPVGHVIDNPYPSVIPKHEYSFNLTGWRCCGQTLDSLPGCTNGHHPGCHTRAGMYWGDSTIERPVFHDFAGKPFLLALDSLSCCNQRVFDIPGCIKEKHRGSLTMTNEKLDDVTRRRKQTFCEQVKCRRKQGGQWNTCQNCHQQYDPSANRSKGCAKHPGAQTFVRQQNRIVYCMFMCCGKTVCDAPACNPLGRWGAGHVSEELIFEPWAPDRAPQLQSNMQEEGTVIGDGLTACCSKGLTEVPGCQPCNHEPDRKDIRKATHAFIRDKIIKEFQKLYTRKESMPAPSGQQQLLTPAEVRAAVQAALAQQGLPLTSQHDAAKHVKATCNICMEELPWAGCIISQQNAILKDSETTCCPDGKHIVCRQCMTELVKSKVADGIVEIKCLDPSCAARAVTPNEISRCITSQAQEVYSKALEAAAFGAVKDGISCPKCNYLEFKADQEALLTSFHCRNCYQVTCLKCSEAIDTASKKPHTCHLTFDRARIELEEVLTKAAVCHCYGCGTEIIKELGCNKMTCARCNRVMCYLCNKTKDEEGLSDFYHHFGAPPKCWLFDQAATDQTEQKAVKDRTVAAVNTYLAGIDAATAFQLGTTSPLLADIRQRINVPLPL